MSAFNDRVAVLLTKLVGSMWCAYIFAALALVGLPGAIRTGTLGIVQWVAQTFLQLVLLSIIMVGQDVQGRAADQRAIETHDAVMQELAVLKALQQEAASK